MFIKRNRNRSGSVSIQIIKKIGRRNKVLKTVGCARTHREEELLFLLAKTEIERMQGTQSLFIEHDNAVVDNFVDSIGNENLQIVGPELILGRYISKLAFLKMRVIISLRIWYCVVWYTREASLRQLSILKGI